MKIDALDRCSPTPISIACMSDGMEGSVRVVVTILKEGKDIFRFEAPVQDGLGLFDIVELAFEDFTAQQPEISLLDPNVHFTIRDANDARQAQGRLRRLSLF